MVEVGRGRIFLEVCSLVFRLVTECLAHHVITHTEQPSSDAQVNDVRELNSFKCSLHKMILR